MASDPGPTAEIVMLPFCCRPAPMSPCLDAPEPCGCPPPAAGRVGSVVFLTHKRRRAEAILRLDGTWHCPELPVLDRVLNALYEPARPGAHGRPFGHAELARVAVWFKGQVRLPSAPGDGERG